MTLYLNEKSWNLNKEGLVFQNYLRLHIDYKAMIRYAINDYFLLTITSKRYGSNFFSVTFNSQYSMRWNISYQTFEHAVPAYTA